MTDDLSRLREPAAVSLARDAARLRESLRVRGVSAATLAVFDRVVAGRLATEGPAASQPVPLL